MESSKVEVSLKERKVHGFLNDLMKLCIKHNVSIEWDGEETLVSFHNWDDFSDLKADGETASLYWPRIQTDIVVRRKNEQVKTMASKKADEA